MRPLIPSVRPGDVLKGTRNLRHYLQTASTLNYVNDLSMRMGGRSRSKSQLYHPSKDDEFMVTVNAWGTFGVYSARDDVVLLFVNPSMPSGVSHQSRYPLRMDPTIFSKWFIRTPKKYVDLTTWPEAPYFMWASLHLNMSSVQSDNAPIFNIQNGASGPFHMGQCGNHYHRPLQRELLLKLIHQWTVRGATRPNSTWNRHLPSGGSGPQLEEIPQMRREIQNICSNPRIAQQLKADANYVYEAFLQNK